MDLLETSKTNTDLIAMLASIIKLGYHVTLTAINTDHSDDSALGTHTHHNGFAVDIGVIGSTAVGNNETTRGFCAAICKPGALAAPGILAKLGLGGDAQALLGEFDDGSVEVFLDDAQPHLHLQTI